MSTKVASMVAKTRSKDACEVSQKKELSVEAQRISSILENCISQVEIVAVLSSVLQLNIMPVAVDKELSKAIQEHQKLFERLETTEGLKKESDGEQEEVGEVRKRACAQIEKDIKNSVRDLLRLFRAHPDASVGFRAVQATEVLENEGKLIKGLKMFHLQMIEKFLTSPDKELQLVFFDNVPSFDDLELLTSKQEQIAAGIKKLDAQISQEKNEIKNLEHSLQSKNTRKEDISFLEDKRCQPNTSKSKNLTNKQHEIDRLSTDLNKLSLENRQAERVLQRNNKEVEKELKHLLQNFDNGIENIQDKLELNEIDNERLEEEMKRLEVSLSVLKVEYEQIQERRLLAEKKRKEEMRMLELKAKAAIFAQAWWRGYSVRKALKNKGKSKKAKKGKGKKK